MTKTRRERQRRSNPRCLSVISSSRSDHCRSTATVGENTAAVPLTAGRTDDVMSGIMRSSVEWERIRLFALLLHCRIIIIRQYHQGPEAAVLREIDHLRFYSFFIASHHHPTIDIDQPYINNVELHRPTVCQQCRTPSTNRVSTMSNSIDLPYLNNVELHRPTVYQQCRTPSTNNVELHRQSHCMSSPAMSNSIDQVVSPSQWCLHQQCRI